MPSKQRRPIATQQCSNLERGLGLKMVSRVMRAQTLPLFKLFMESLIQIRTRKNNRKIPLILGQTKRNILMKCLHAWKYLVEESIL